MPLMTIMITVFGVLFAFHCLADYSLQTDYLADNKSNNNYILLCHVAIYALTLTFGFWFVSQYTGNISLFWNNFDFIFWCLFITHLVIDYSTCRSKAKFKQLVEVHNNYTEGQVARIRPSDMDWHNRIICKSKETLFDILLLDQIAHMFIIITMVILIVLKK
jgi:hypothetical protein